MTASNQTAHTQILLDDDVVDSSHDEANLHRIGGAGEVGVDLLRGVLVEAGEEVVSSCFQQRKTSDMTYETNLLRM